jgi:nucleotide-binding universal stress UspA family protein
MPQKILVALDGSRPSESVLPYVASLMKVIDADLTLYRVVPPGSPAERQKARAYLERVAGKLRRRGAFVDVAVAAGKPAEEITEFAGHEGYDLVALASRRKKGLKRVVLGSVAEEILRRSPVPVLVTAARPAEAPSPAPPRSIVVPQDGSHRSAAVLVPVAALAKAAGAKISFVTVVSPTEREELPVETAAHTLFSRQKALQEEGLDVEIGILFGNPVDEILRFAEARHADLLAVATHGRTGLERWRYGSVTEALLRKSQVPLLVVRSLAQARTGALGPRAAAARRRALETAAAAANPGKSPYSG